MKINHARWITVTDVVAFVSLLFLAFSGVVIRYVLPKGSGGGGGPGWRAASRPVLEFLGMSRHEWGGVHFWVSMLFVVTIAVHLLLHWKWVRVSFLPRGRRVRS
ncbi:DUF4405 domain-containing protein [Kiritimatiellaeota bacterium B1221]|nr:DUF4405 domain-containing protein [Kiritimatiellaeota bacterium B1221]